ncbi:DNA polymerase III subunit chi, partial [Morganella morganii]|uniref:DNA polymerase III subunit chi n=1 Tax=Morganella morganii TaxID=582 RepID=UPI0015F6D4EF
MKNATFYLMEQPSPFDDLGAREWLTYHLARQAWRSGKRVLLACESQHQAEKL